MFEHHQPQAVPDCAGSKLRSTVMNANLTSFFVSTLLYASNLRQSTTPPAVSLVPSSGPFTQSQYFRHLRGRQSCRIFNSKNNTSQIPTTKYGWNDQQLSINDQQSLVNELPATDNISPVLLNASRTGPNNRWFNQYSSITISFPPCPHRFNQSHEKDASR